MHDIIKSRNTSFLTFLNTKGGKGGREANLALYINYI